MLKVHIIFWYTQEKKGKKIKLLLFESNQVGKYYLDGILQQSGCTEYQFVKCQGIFVGC